MDMKRHMLNCFFISTSVTSVSTPSVYLLQNRETQHVNIVLQCTYELNGKPSSVTTFSTDFSFQNLVFWNLFDFSAAEIT